MNNVPEKRDANANVEVQTSLIEKALLTWKF